MSGTVREVALRTPMTTLPETSICDAEQRLIAGNAREIHVIDHEERLLGVVLDVDFLNYRLLGGDGRAGIGTLMVSPDLTLSPQSTLAEAAVAFQHPSRNTIAILQGGRLIGGLWRTDLMRILIDQDIRLPVPAVLAEEPARIPPPKSSYFTQTGGLGRLFAR